MTSMRVEPARPQKSGSTTQASLSNLPPELVLHIVEAIFNCHGDDWLKGYEAPDWNNDIGEDFPYTRFSAWRDVARLAATCKRLDACVTPTLYRKDIKYASSSALLWSAKTGNVSAIAKSLFYGADVNATDDTGVEVQQERRNDTSRFCVPSKMTSLHWAAYHHHLDVIELLLRQGADISLRETSFEKWPRYQMKCDMYLQARSCFEEELSYLSSMGRAWMFEAMCEGANVLYFSLLESYEHQDNDYPDSCTDEPDPGRNKSRLMAASLLIQAGASLTTHSGMQLNALHQACASRDLEMVQLLLEREEKPDANVRDFLGNTPLHYVAICSSYYSAKNPQPVIQSLLKHGADINAANASGLTPLQECCRPQSKYSSWLCTARRIVYPWEIRRFVEAGASLSPFPDITDGTSPLRGNEGDSERTGNITRRLYQISQNRSLSVSRDSPQEEAENKAMYMGMYRRLHQHQQDGQARLEMNHSIPDWTLDEWKVFWDAKFLEETVLATLSKDGRAWIEASAAVGSGTE